jgi:hypothetical protein
MNAIKNVMHYVIFAVGSCVGTWIVLLLLTTLPLLGFLLIYKLSNFWFFVAGGIMMTIYYSSFDLLGWFYFYLDKRKPDFWFSNIFIVVVVLIYFYLLITSLATNLSKEPKAFLNFKGIVFLVSILPAYLKILYISLLLPFIKTAEVTNEEI